MLEELITMLLFSYFILRLTMVQDLPLLLCHMPLLIHLPGINMLLFLIRLVKELILEVLLLYILLRTILLNYQLLFVVLRLID